MCSQWKSYDLHNYFLPYLMENSHAVISCKKEKLPMATWGNTVLACCEMPFQNLPEGTE